MVCDEGHRCILKAVSRQMLCAAGGEGYLETSASAQTGSYVQISTMSLPLMIAIGVSCFGTSAGLSIGVFARAQRLFASVQDIVAVLVSTGAQKLRFF